MVLGEESGRRLGEVIGVFGDSSNQGVWESGIGLGVEARGGSEEEAGVGVGETSRFCF